MDMICDYASEEEKDERKENRSCQCAHELPSADQLLECGVKKPKNGGDGTDVHQGRVRSFPHVEGNYATLVYVNVPLPSEFKNPLEKILRNLKEKMPDVQPILSSHKNAVTSSDYLSQLESDTMVQQEYHLSLSRPAPVVFNQIEFIKDSLRHNLRRLEPFVICIENSLEIFVNEEKTRTFLALKVRGESLKPQLSAAQQPVTHFNLKPKHAKSNPIKRAIEATSKSLVLHGMKPYYQNPRPHISVAWLLGDRSKELLAASRDPSIVKLLHGLETCNNKIIPSDIIFRAGKRCMQVWTQ